MRRIVSLLTVAVLLLSLGCAAFAEEAPRTQEAAQVIRCEQQEFSTLCSPSYNWNYTARDGITIYTERQGSIPYVLVFRMKDWIVDVADYIREQYTPYMQKQYGEALVSCQEFDHYSIGGRDMAVGLYTYRLQGYLIDMIRAYEVQDRHTVVYTAKFIRGRGDATLAALEQAVAGYRPDVDYYETIQENERWANTVTTTPDGDICYSFGEVSVTLPGDWAGKYNIAVSENRVTFYQSLSRRLWSEEKGYEGGRLFSVGFSETEDFRQLPSFDELGQGAEGWYFLEYPTDYQAYEQDRWARNEYDEMHAGLGFVSDNAFCFVPEAVEVTAD